MTTDNYILAIVGSRTFADDITAANVARELIEIYIDQIKPTGIISGDATGIDKLAEVIAEYRGIPFNSYCPVNNHWEPHGYRERNALVAETCDGLLCIMHHRSTTYGSGWTADYAKKIGKIVFKFLYNQDGKLVEVCPL